MKTQERQKRIEAIRKKIEELRTELDGFYANLRPSEKATREERIRIEEEVTMLQKKLKQF